MRRSGAIGHRPPAVQKDSSYWRYSAILPDKHRSALALGDRGTVDPIAHTRIADSATRNQALIQAAFDGLNWAERRLTAFVIRSTKADEVTRLSIEQGAANERHGCGFGRRRDTALQAMRFGDTDRDQLPQRPIDPRTRRMRWREQPGILDHHLSLIHI